MLFWYGFFSASLLLTYTLHCPSLIDPGLTQGNIYTYSCGSCPFILKDRVHFSIDPTVPLISLRFPDHTLISILFTTEEWFPCFAPVFWFIFLWNCEHRKQIKIYKKGNVHNRIHTYIVRSHSEQLDVSSYLKYCVEKYSLANEMWIRFLACRECYRRGTSLSLQEICRVVFLKT